MTRSSNSRRSGDRPRVARMPEWQISFLPPPFIPPRFRRDKTRPIPRLVSSTREYQTIFAFPLPHHFCQLPLFSLQPSTRHSTLPSALYKQWTALTQLPTVKRIRGSIDICRWTAMNFCAKSTPITFKTPSICTVSEKMSPTTNMP